VFSFPYGLFRTKNYFGLRWRQLLEWHQEALALFGWIIPVAVITWWLTREMPLPVRLGINAGVVGTWTLWGLLRHGFNQALKFEVMARAPGWAQPILLWTGLRREQK
jgi:hypothetical protein